ncbi:TPA: oligosaccharide repeat unit polymerase [Vibrio vulnificus]|nr:oligosaccharide repeat unit polymerase [Vibrio vulnificus]
MTLFNKVFLPVITLAIFQVIGYLLYDGFLIELSSYDIGFVLSLYISLIIGIFLFNLWERRKLLSVESKPFGKCFIGFVFLSSLALLLKPTITMYVIGSEIGFDLLRTYFFTDFAIRTLIYENLWVEWFTNQYYIYFLWFFLVFISNRSERYSVFIFYSIMLLLVLYNMAYAGRFNIYYSIVLIYIRSVLLGESLSLFIKNKLPVISIFVLLSFFVLLLRSTEGDIQSISRDILILIEYHLVPPFYLSERISDGMLLMSEEPFPFKSFITSAFLPLFYLFDYGAYELPWFKYALYFNEFSLYSEYSEKYYNAFSTLFSFFYIDYYYTAPFFVLFFILFVLCYSRLIKNIELRFKYQSFFSLMLYMSFFKPMLFSPGVIVILIFFPLFYRCRNIWLMRK